jgi:2-oxoisovalerate dehydrogenase E2 component (dihydrolipoyl transacylase)
VSTFRLPDLGEGLADAELLGWRVAVGDTVALNQVIAEVETAKAAVELPSPFAGVVAALHAAEGDVVAVGAELITFAPSPAPLVEEGRTPVLVGYGATSGTSSRRRVPAPSRPSAPAPGPVDPAASSGPVASPPDASASSGSDSPVVPASVGPVPGAPVAAGPAPGGLAAGGLAPGGLASGGLAPSGRPLAKPLVRKLARDRGVDLTRVRGTGAGGIVTRQDVLDHLAALPAFSSASSTAALSASVAPPVVAHTSASPASSAVSLPPGSSRAVSSPAVSGSAVSSPAGSSSAGSSSVREERIPVRGVRRSTAQAMVRSAFTAPQVTVFHTVDVTPTMELLRRLRESSYTEGVRLTVLAFVAKALLSALPRHPTLNSAWDEAAQEIVLKHQVNLGIATATPRGLMVPNLKDAGDLDLMALARGLARLTETARSGQASPADLTGGTISITNVGVFGVDTGTPLLNPGEAAILCLGAVREQPWVHEGALAVRWVTTLGLSFDHRLVDGEQGARFLADIGTTLGRA